MEKHSSLEPVDDGKNSVKRPATLPSAFYIALIGQGIILLDLMYGIQRLANTASSFTLFVLSILLAVGITGDFILFKVRDKKGSLYWAGIVMTFIPVAALVLGLIFLVWLYFGVKYS